MRWDGSSKYHYRADVCRAKYERCRPDVPEQPRHLAQRRKDRRRWCGGHVGRLHDYVRRPEQDRAWREVWRCQRCGRWAPW